MSGWTSPLKKLKKGQVENIQKDEPGDMKHVKVLLGLMNNQKRIIKSLVHSGSVIYNLQL